ncbi:hypothetical protein J31TS4_18090 [Paenibacillus sp. J31TS4]|uniref:hypothetical protein n=1 Tax=Paenibacillus sp. J31TS4 TaxID=2807195 RepID=UPI001B2ADE48|nr:hypothetical protein [Paenibacillus sp. J31TS4]GIP38529.1 hypothetical protein J31TS4_18090 [Paenibacillus sp. J31TS4]
MRAKETPALSAVAACLAASVLLSAGWVLWEALHLSLQPSVLGWLLLSLALLLLTQAVRVVRTGVAMTGSAAGAMAISIVVLAIGLFMLNA